MKRLIAITLLALVWGGAALAQGPAAGGAPARPILAATAAPMRIAAGARAEALVTLRVEPGWHVNANPPALDYMIPTAVEIAGEAGVNAARPVYPEPRRLKLAFEETPLLVYDGEAVVKLPLAAAATAVNGTHALRGRVRYQACNDEMCLPPVTASFTLEVTVTGGVASESTAAAAPGSTAAAAPGSTATPPRFDTGPPPGTARSAALEDPIARAFARGSWLAFLMLFVLGLGLNLTPCVYPMIGVTVSVFGARRAESPLKVLGHALVYVLGMAVMYSALGLVASLTGGMFGGLLQNPAVLVGIGVLFALLSLSMFGLYQLQVPPQLLARLGGSGATNLVGLFLSGLLVGIIAAPCVGPPVVALVALVGAKGDPWFGFWSFFVLAMGLGAPYLVLGTFSNLLQRLPRSGDWMEWVERLFGTILLAFGAYYVLLGLRPEWSRWVIPVTLILAGVWLGFLRKSAARRGFSLFRRVLGGITIVGGAALLVTARPQGVAFRGFSPEALAADLEAGRTAMLDFSADWCIPCRELEDLTFTDKAVIAAAKDFAAYEVDLTHYDSPESEALRRRYGITGVPTVVFLRPDGSEAREARVVGFLPAGPFLEHMKVAR